MGACFSQDHPGHAQKREPACRRRRPRGLARFFARFARDREAAAAIEFSIVAVPFCALLFALIETTTVFFANGVLDNAVQETSRMIRTGRVQAGGFTEEQFRTEVCNQINVILACDARLKIDVRTFSQFNNVAFSSPLDANGD
ncbi:MAG TPA: pilus assembly protein, partial [Micropepsaceae bacterium]|nr:pilus assembly protein [Micropepsaceae bacterium]